MAAPATAVDTATGQVEAPKGEIYWTTTRQPGTRILRFKNTFEHYVNNVGGNPVVRTVTNMVPGNYAGLENHEGLYVVPYHNRGIAFIMQQFYRLVQNVDAVKVRKMGFRIKKVTVLQEALTTRASTTILENTFQSRLSCFLYVDNEHLLDNLVGEPGLTEYLTPSAFNPALSDPQSVYPSFAAVSPTRVTSNAAMFQHAATLPCWATSQQAGSLINCSIYYQNLADNLPWTMHDVLTGIEFGEPVEGVKIMSQNFTWENPKPEWEMIQGYGFKINKNPDYSRGTDTSNGSPLWATRERALSMVYRGTIHPEATDDAVQIGPSREFADRASDQYGVNNLLSKSYSPPYVYLKVEPIQGPTGPMTFTMRIMFEYHIQVEVKQYSVLPGWVQDTLFTGDLDNRTIISHGVTFANPRMHVGQGSQVEWDNYLLMRNSSNEGQRKRAESPSMRNRKIRQPVRPGKRREIAMDDSESKKKRSEDEENRSPPNIDYMGPSDNNELPNDISSDMARRYKQPESYGN